MSPGLTARDVLIDELDDGPAITASAKFLYDGVLDGFEFQGFRMNALEFSKEALWQALDDIKNQMAGLDESGNRTFVISSVMAGSSLLLTTGLISWVLRGGALASALLSTLPLWKGFDPLPLLAARRRKNKTKKGQNDTQSMDRTRDIGQSRPVGDAESMFTQSFAATDSTPGAGRSL
jgi:hypothetical protein